MRASRAFSFGTRSPETPTERLIRHFGPDPYYDQFHQLQMVPKWLHLSHSLNSGYCFVLRGRATTNRKVPTSRRKVQGGQLTKSNQTTHPRDKATIVAVLLNFTAHDGSATGLLWVAGSSPRWVSVVVLNVSVSGVWSPASLGG